MSISETTCKIAVSGGEITAFRLASEKMAHQTPLIYVHGGPGGTCDMPKKYLRELAADRPLIFYDQLGSYHSPAPFSEDLMNLDRFTQELHDVFNAFSLDRAALLGHSWGACIAIDYALTHADKVETLILSSPLISAPQWIEDTNALLAQLPQETQDIIRQHEAEGTTDSDEYDIASKEFYKRHFCRVDPWPQEVLDSFKKTNMDLYLNMWGPSEFTCSGTLKNYDRFPDLPRLSMPVMLMAGRYDEARPETMEKAAALIPDARVTIFESSAHGAYFEETNAYIAALRNFLPLKNTP